MQTAMLLTESKELAHFLIPGPLPQVHQARLSWLGVALADKIRWDQTSDAVMLWLQLPQGTHKQDLTVAIQTLHLTGTTSF